MILIGTSMMTMQQAKQQAEAASNAQRGALEQSARNQNQLVEQSFEKRKQALGLGGSQAGGSQQGTVLTSVTGDSQNAMGL